MGRKYALIWCLNSSYKGVVQLSTFPVKHRAVGTISNLTWMDHQTGVKTKAQAKILAIGDDTNAVHNIFVSDEGKILEHSTKIFSKEALDEKKSLDQNNKFKKNVTKSNKRQFETAMKKESSIVPKCTVTHKKQQVATNFRYQNDPQTHQNSAGTIQNAERIHQNHSPFYQNPLPTQQNPLPTCQNSPLTRQYENHSTFHNLLPIPQYPHHPSPHQNPPAIQNPLLNHHNPPMTTSDIIWTMMNPIILRPTMKQ